MVNVKLVINCDSFDESENGKAALKITFSRQICSYMRVADLMIIVKFKECSIAPAQHRLELER